MDALYDILWLQSAIYGTICRGGSPKSHISDFGGYQFFKAIGLNNNFNHFFYKKIFFHGLSPPPPPSQKKYGPLKWIKKKHYIF